MRILIDADPIVYSCGFACEHRISHIQWVDVNDPDDPYSDIPNMASDFHAWWEAEEFMEEHNIVREEIIKHVEVRGEWDDELGDWMEEPSLPNTLHVVKQRVQNIVKACTSFVEEWDTGIESVELYLTDGKSNFRNEVATIRGYKANRDPDHKPYYYEEIREYLAKQHGARTMYGYEADDAVAMAQYQADENSTIICTVDKDLKMVPGLHYNYQTKEESYVTDEQAQEFFWTQLLTGDATDNIAGCFHMGPAKSRNLIAASLEELVAGRGRSASYEEREQALYEAVRGAYEGSIAKYEDACPYAEMGADAALLENARLLWMQEYPGQLWTPPGQPDERLPGYDGVEANAAS